MKYVACVRFSDVKLFIHTMSFLFIVNFVWVSSTLQVSFLASEMSRFVIEKTELLAVVNDGYSVLIRGYYQMMKINSGGG